MSNVNSIIDFLKDARFSLMSIERELDIREANRKQTEKWGNIVLFGTLAILGTLMSILVGLIILKLNH